MPSSIGQQHRRVPPGSGARSALPSIRRWRRMPGRSAGPGTCMRTARVYCLSQPVVRGGWCRRRRRGFPSCQRRASLSRSSPALSRIPRRVSRRPGHAAAAAARAGTRVDAACLPRRSSTVAGTVQPRDLLIISGTAPLRAQFPARASPRAAGLKAASAARPPLAGPPEADGTQLRRRRAGTPAPPGHRHTAAARRISAAQRGHGRLEHAGSHGHGDLS